MWINQLLGKLWQIVSANFFLNSVVNWDYSNHKFFPMSIYFIVPMLVVFISSLCLCKRAYLIFVYVIRNTETERILTKHFFTIAWMQSHRLSLYMLTHIFLLERFNHLLSQILFSGRVSAHNTMWYNFNCGVWIKGKHFEVQVILQCKHDFKIHFLLLLGDEDPLLILNLFLSNIFYYFPHIVSLMDFGYMWWGTWMGKLNLHLPTFLLLSV